MHLEQTDGDLPRRTRVAAYAVILRDDEILLSRLAAYLTAEELWTLPGGGLDFGEHPADALVREVHEETGLSATVGEVLFVDSARRFASISGTDMHSIRIVYAASVPADSPEPRVVEVDGSTVEARWHRLSDCASGAAPLTEVARLAVDRHLADGAGR